jgi:hypothetical protein
MRHTSLALPRAHITPSSKSNTVAECHLRSLSHTVSNHLRHTAASQSSAGSRFTGAPFTPKLPICCPKPQNKQRLNHSRCYRSLPQVKPDCFSLPYPHPSSAPYSEPSPAFFCHLTPIQRWRGPIALPLNKHVFPQSPLHPCHIE